MKARAPRRAWKRKVGATLTVGQIAERVGVNVKTVRKWIDSGKLPGMRLPGDENQQRERRVHPDVLREFLERIGYTRTTREVSKLPNGTPTPSPPEEKPEPPAQPPAPEEDIF
jgi:excisionase family DNA binding protein